jgi:hypothetical protein
MFTSHDGRGRRIARTLTTAALSAALAGSAAAVAAGTGTGTGTGSGTGGTPAPVKPVKRVARAADCAKPDPGDGAERLPLPADDPIVQEARTRLQALVTAGTAAQGEVDAVLREVIAGSVDLDALVKAGTLSAAHVEAIDAVLKDIKNRHVGKPENVKPQRAPAESGPSS